MDRFIAKHLYEILESINAFESYIEPIATFNDYKNSRQTRRSVEREFEIIAEALSRILTIEPQFKITSSELIRGMRNRIIHAYDSIDDAIVYNAVRRHLPELKIEIVTLLAT